MNPPVDLEKVCFLRREQLGTAETDDPLGMVLPVLLGLPPPPPDRSLLLRCVVALDSDTARDLTPLLILELQEPESDYHLMVGLIAHYWEWVTLVAEKGYLALGYETPGSAPQPQCCLLPLDGANVREGFARFLAAARPWMSRHPEAAAPLGEVRP